MQRHGRYGCVDPNDPEAAGVCDRGGEVVKHRDLRREMHWAGGRLVWNGLMVCERHRDVPNPQIGGPSPLRRDAPPVKDPRPEAPMPAVVPAVTVPPGRILAFPE